MITNRLPFIDGVAIAKIRSGKGFRPELLARAFADLAAEANKLNAKTCEATFNWHLCPSDAEYIPYVIVGVKRTEAGNYQARNRNPRGNIKAFQIRWKDGKIVGTKITRKRRT